ncbi:MAG: UDP-glucose 4-epimerase GalE [Candidatus Korobacteraceae bacterium]|jgi:UDP-glucose-4-epimerase GalE
MRILVTGGAGYVGSHAIRSLARHGHRVTVYDNLSTGHRFLADGFELIVADLGDAPQLSRALSDIDLVMHFAGSAYVGESVLNPRKYFHNNVQNGLALVNAAMDAGVRHFLFSSSCAVYGTPEKVPITEDTRCQPVNPYGDTKLFFERVLEAYCRAYDLRAVALRYFNAAGADESGEIGELHHPETHLIPLALEAAAGLRPQLELFGNDYPTFDGTCIRDYIHVTDLAEAHALAAELLQRQSGGAFTALNLGSGGGHSVQQVVSAVEKVSGRSVPLRITARRAGDPPSLVADPTRARQLLRWSANRSLEEIVASAWKWLHSGRRQHVNAGAASSGEGPK